MSLYPDPLDERLNDSESAFWDQGRIHNWQNYIGENTRRIWAQLTDDIKTALATDAQETADSEDWE